jgi:zinc protease
VGDVDPQAVLALARKHFGTHRAGALPVRKPQTEPAQKGLQRITVKAPAELPFVAMAYRAPLLQDPQNDWEPYAMEMLAAVLDGNPAARLNRILVRTERVASSVDASYDGISRGPGLFYLTATPTTGRTVQEVEQAVRRELQRIVTEGVDAEELERVKAQAVAAHVYQRDSMFFQARQIGGLEMAGISHRHIDLMLEKLKAVSAEQVQAVAKKYLVDDQLTIAYLDPQPLSEKRKPPAGLRHGE